MRALRRGARRAEAEARHSGAKAARLAAALEAALAASDSDQRCAAEASARVVALQAECTLLEVRLAEARDELLQRRRW